MLKLDLSSLRRLPIPGRDARNIEREEDKDFPDGIWYRREGIGKIVERSPAEILELRIEAVKLRKREEWEANAEKIRKQRDRNWRRFLKKQKLLSKMTEEERRQYKLRRKQMREMKRQERVGKLSA